MASSAWRAQRNAKALARLQRNLPEIFPAPVLLHALARPFIPPTPRRAIESYWRQHPVRADKLARALAALSGPPEGWVWRIGSRNSPGVPLGFRAPPAPFRQQAQAKGPGYCCVCGQPVFRFGWHRDLWRDAERAGKTWPALLIYWGVPNLQVINRSAHAEKCGLESAARARLRQTGSAERSPGGWVRELRDPHS